MLLSVLMSVLGAWVAQIIVEQAIFVRRQGGMWRLWLLVVALALGGVSIWCAQLTATAALTVSKPDSSSLPVLFSADVSLLAALPALCLTWCGLIVLIGDTQRCNVTSVPPKTTAAQQQQLSATDHLDHLWQSCSWRVVLGGLLVSAAVVVTRTVLWYVWVQDATLESDNWAWLGTTLLDLLLIPAAMLIYFHAFRWRIVGVFAFVVAVMADYQIHLLSMNFSYAEPGTTTLPKALLTADVSEHAVTFAASIIAATICLIFVGLQFSRMRLSRNALSGVVGNMETHVKQLKTKQRASEQHIAQLQAQLTTMSRIQELIALCTPQATETAFTLAASTTHNHYFDLVAALSSELQLFPTAVPLKSPSRSQQRARSRSSWASGSASVVAAVVSGNSTSETDTIDEDDRTVVVVASPRPRPVAAAAIDGQLPSLTHGLHVRTTSQPETEASSISPPQPVRKASGTDLSNTNSAVQLEMRNTPVQSEKSHVRLLSRPSSQLASSAPLAVRTITRVGRAGSHTTGRKYEDQLHQLLEAQLAYKDDSATPPQALLPPNSLPPLSTTPRSATTVATTAATATPPTLRRARQSAAEAPWDTGFELTAPLLDKTGEVSGSHFAAPSLLTLLSHPVCVEVVKARLMAIHSVENLSFYLLAVRYRLVQSPKLRRSLASAIYAHFIRENAAQQINISTRQRDAIAAVVSRKNDECTVDLFKEAEREVLQLMETNVMKALSGSVTMRLCSWVLAAVPLGSLMPSSAAVDEADGVVANLSSPSSRRKMQLRRAESSVASGG